MNELKRGWMKKADHEEITRLANKAGKTIVSFISDLIKAYKGKSK